MNLLKSTLKGRNVMIWIPAHTWQTTGQWVIAPVLLDPVLYPTRAVTEEWCVQATTTEGTWWEEEVAHKDSIAAVWTTADHHQTVETQPAVAAVTTPMEDANIILSFPPSSISISFSNLYKMKLNKHKTLNWRIISFHKSFLIFHNQLFFFYDLILIILLWR